MASCVEQVSIAVKNGKTRRQMSDWMPTSSFLDVYILPEPLSQRTGRWPWRLWRRPRDIHWVRNGSFGGGRVDEPGMSMQSLLHRKAPVEAKRP